MLRLSMFAFAVALISACGGGGDKPALQVDAGPAGGGGGTPNMAGSGGGPAGGDPVPGGAPVPGGMGGVPASGGEPAPGGNGGVPVPGGNGGVPVPGGMGGEPAPGGSPPSGGAGGQPMPGGMPMGGMPMGGEPAPPVGLDCDALCLGFEADCPGHFARRETCAANCTSIVSGASGNVHPATYQRAAGVCEEAGRTLDCNGIYACISDNDDGLTAFGSLATVDYRGIVDGVAINVDAADAWVAVGTKRDGTPGDLEFVFVHQGAVYVLELNDFVTDFLPGRDVADLVGLRAELVRDMANVNLRIRAATVDAFALDGRFDITLTLRDEDAAIPAATTQVIVHVTGTLQQ